MNLSCRRTDVMCISARICIPAVLFNTLIKWLPQPANKPGPELPSPPVMPGIGGQSEEAVLRLALDQIPGLDASFGLQSVRGRLASYCRLLGKFSSTHDDDFAQIQQYLAGAKTADARRLAHSIKGAAGTLGAIALQKKAAALEAAIRDELPMATIEPLLNDCANSYRQLSAHLDAILAAPSSQADTPPPPVIQDAARDSLLSELRSHLRSGDIVCLNLLNQNIAMLQEILGHDYRPFETAINSFDFEGALTILDRSPSIRPA